MKVAKLTGRHFFKQFKQLVLSVVNQLGPLNDQLAKRQIAIQHWADQAVLVMMLYVVHLKERGQQIYVRQKLLSNTTCITKVNDSSDQFKFTITIKKQSRQQKADTSNKGDK